MKVVIKAVIFDFDGVLVESVDIKTNAFALLFKPEGKDVVRKVVGYHLKHGGISRFEKFIYIYKAILKRRLADETFRRLCGRFAKLVVDEVVKAPYVKGAKYFLDSHSGDYKYFVSSATPQAEIEEIIKKRKMARYFHGVYGAPKDKRDIVKAILADHHLEPRDCVYIGDAMSDYEAAVDNGVNFIAKVANGIRPFDAIRCPKVKDLVGLKETLTKLENGRYR